MAEQSTFSLCVLCCYSFSTTTTYKQTSEKLSVNNGHECLRKFCKQVDSNYTSNENYDWIRTDGNSTSSLSICKECLLTVEAATITREEAEKIEADLRILQLQVLSLLYKLRRCLRRYEDEMTAIEGKMKESDESCLKVWGQGDVYINEGVDVHVDKVLRFRGGISRVIRELNMFQTEVAPKFLDNDLEMKSLAGNKENALFTHEFDDDYLRVDELDEILSTSPQADEVTNVVISSPSVEETPPMPRRSSRPKRNVSAPTTASLLPARGKLQKKPKKDLEKTQINSTSVQLTHISWRSSSKLKKSTYGCTICPTFTARNVYFLEQHLQEHEQSSVFRGEPSIFSCPDCTATFAIEQLYELHVGSHTGNFKTPCDQCHKHYPSLALEAHIRSEHTISKIFQCANCSFCCSTRDSYLRHLLKHYGGKAVMACDLCSETFSARHNLLQHLYDVHRAIEKIPCNVPGCTSTFLDDAAKRSHLPLHTDRFICHLCNLRCINQAALKLHQETHSIAKPWKCDHPDCEQTFKSELALKNHHNKHLLSRSKFQCHICDKSYFYKDSWVSHMKIHKGEGETCDQCGDTLANKRSLRRHIALKHSKSNSDMLHFCELCGQGFKMVDKLKRHLNLHGEKTHTCTLCGKTFARKDYLQLHMKIHNDERAHVCTHCGKRFNQPAALYQHKRIVHSDVDNKKSSESEAV